MEERRADAEGGRVVQREWRARKLAIVVAVQNVLVAACLLVTLHVYRGVQSPQASGGNVHIQFDPIAGTSGNQTLQFENINSMNEMSLTDKKEKININCTGPYVLYMYVCCRSLEQSETTGTLQLKVVGNETPLTSFPLKVSHEDCRGHHNIVYLKATQQASLHLYAKDDFKIVNVTVGLSYLLGSQCVF